MDIKEIKQIIKGNILIEYVIIVLSQCVTNIQKLYLLAGYYPLHFQTVLFSFCSIN